MSCAWRGSAAVLCAVLEALAIEGDQAITGARPVALFISRLQLAARRGARGVHQAGDLPADFPLQGTTARRRSVGTGHAHQVCVQPLDAGVGESPLGCFSPIDRNAEVGAAGATLPTHILRRQARLGGVPISAQARTAR